MCVGDLDPTVPPEMLGRLERIACMMGDPQAGTYLAGVGLGLPAFEEPVYFPTEDRKEVDRHLGLGLRSSDRQSKPNSRL